MPEFRKGSISAKGHRGQTKFAFRITRSAQRVHCSQPKFVRHLTFERSTRTIPTGGRPTTKMICKLPQLAHPTRTISAEGRVSSALAGPAAFERDQDHIEETNKTTEKNKRIKINIEILKNNDTSQRQLKNQTLEISDEERHRRKNNDRKP